MLNLGRGNSDCGRAGRSQSLPLTFPLALPLVIAVTLLGGWLPGEALGQQRDQAEALQSDPLNPSPLDFRNDVAPILTKLGCNGGGCHGKSTGRGGFLLSLFGFRPHDDYLSITRGSRARRVFPAAPEQSLLLRKATMSVPHGGGKRVSADAPEYRLLRDWIAANTPWGPSTAPRLVGLSLEPKQQVLDHHQQLQLTAVATYADGSRRDVSRLVEYRSNTPTIAAVGEHGLVTSAARSGETAIVALYQGEVAVSRMVIPRAETTPDEQRRLEEFPVANLIDAHTLSKWRQLRVPPVALCGDATFLRRATVQLAGRLPTTDEVREFLASSSQDKREQLVARLLGSEDYADHFAQKWCDILRIKRRGQKDRMYGTTAFHRWVRNALAANLPYDQFVREIITATGNVSVNPTAQWYAEVRYLDRYVDDTAQVFLGLRIGCARCHHHPFEKYSQEDYYGLAAFFARVDRKGGAGVAERRANETVYVKPSGEVKHPVTDEVVLPRGLGGPSLEIPPHADPRHHLVDWMTARDNPFFARALVNRLWAHFFGRGLVEPLDDMRVTNPATIEPLLDALAKEFVDSGYDVKHVLQLICTSSTYQLSSLADEANLGETQNHARFYPQRLSAEVLLDAIDQVTETKTSYSGLPAGTRAVQLPDEGYSNEFLQLFGRPNRESACECERVAEPSLSQSLFVMNNAFVLGKISSTKGFATKLAKAQDEPSAKIETLFLKTLGRHPSTDEMREAADYLRSEKDAETAFANLLWALINTKEFLYCH